MEITVNGEPSDFEETNVNLSRLLELHKVESPEMVAVQLNGEFIGIDSYPTTYLNPGDNVEFLFFMGGGSW